MFQRLARVFKSWIGYFISFAEDPEVMLQQAIEEMQGTMPKLNQILIDTLAAASRLEQQKKVLERKERDLTLSIKAALTDGSPEARKVAEKDALTLQQVRQDLTATEELLVAARNARDNAQLTVEDIKAKLKAKIEEANRAIRESRKAAELKKAAGALAELEQYGTASTADKYLEEIKQRVAESKASVEVATGGLDTERIKLERKAREIQAQGVLAEFEVEMGLKKPQATPEAAPFPEGDGGQAAPQRTPEGV